MSESIFDVAYIDRAANSLACKLLAKYKTVERLRAELDKHRAKQARLDDGNKCHTQENMAIRAQGLRIAIEVVEASE